MNCTCVRIADGKRRKYKRCLHDAVSSGDIKAVRELAADSSVDVNLLDCAGYSPMVIAICLGHVRIVRFLVARGGATFPRDVRTLFEDVTHAGHVDMLRFLMVECRIHVATNYVCCTLLVIAVENGHIDMVRFLVEHASCIKYDGRDGSMSAHMYSDHMCRVIPRIAAKHDHVEVFRFLVTHKDCHLDTKKRAGLLWTAVTNDSVKIVRFLVEELHVDATMEDAYNESILHIAVHHCSSKTISYCIEEAGLSPSLFNCFGDRPLDISMNPSKFPCTAAGIARYLVAAGGIWNRARVRLYVNPSHVQYQPLDEPSGLTFLYTEADMFQFKVVVTTFLRAVNDALVLTRDAYLVSLIARLHWMASTSIGRHLPSAIGERVADRIVVYALDRSRTYDESAFLAMVR